MIHQKQIEKFENSLHREKVGFNIKCKSWYEEDFNLSANEYWGRGKGYFINCGTKYLGKPVKDLIKKLRSHPDYMHNKAFKRAVDDFIKSDLTTKTSNSLIVDSFYHSNSYYYVDEDNLVQYYIKTYGSYLYDSTYFKKHYFEYLKIARNVWRLKFEKENTKIFEYYHSTFKYIVRYNGLHYYITNEDLDYADILYKYVPRLTATHQVVINNAKKVLQLLKLSPNDLKYHALVDIKESVDTILKYKGD